MNSETFGVIKVGTERQLLNDGRVKGKYNNLGEFDFISRGFSPQRGRNSILANGNVEN